MPKNNAAKNESRIFIKGKDDKSMNLWFNMMGLSCGNHAMVTIPNIRPKIIFLFEIILRCISSLVIFHSSINVTKK